MQLTTLSGRSALRSRIACISSAVASRIGWASLRGTEVAPRSANSRMARDCVRARASAGPVALAAVRFAGCPAPLAGAQAVDLSRREQAVRAGGQPAELERP